MGLGNGGAFLGDGLRRGCYWRFAWWLADLRLGHPRREPDPGGTFVVARDRAVAFLHGRGYVVPEDVKEIAKDETGCGWVDLTLELTVGEKTTTECTARVALPVSGDDNPWQRKGDRWRP